jgi:hypothetical protein
METQTSVAAPAAEKTRTAATLTATESTPPIRSRRGRSLRFGGSWLVVLIVTGCSSGAGAAPTGGTATQPAAGEATQPAASKTAVGGAALGYDCETLLTPAELDAASGLKGGTVSTTHRGDQPGAGDVPGVTECAIEIPTASVWFGHIHVLDGNEALANFDVGFGFAKDQGAGTLAGVGTEALLRSDETGVNGWARDGDGAAVEVGVAWDEETTTEDAVKNAVRQILITVLSRT